MRTSSVSHRRARGSRSSTVTSTINGLTRGSVAMAARSRHWAASCTASRHRARSSFRPMGSSSSLARGVYDVSTPPNRLSAYVVLVLRDPLLVYQPLGEAELLRVQAADLFAQG